jgi:hypothetical protein
VTRGTRPKKPSSSRDFACEFYGARGVWEVWGFWGLKTENCKFLFFQAGNNYQKKILFFIFIFIFIFFPRVRANHRLRPQGRGKGREGEVRGGRKCVRPRRRPCPHGRWGASADALMSARTGVFYSRELHNGCYSASESRTTQRPSSDRPTVRPLSSV